MSLFDANAGYITASSSPYKSGSATNDYSYIHKNDIDGTFIVLSESDAQKTRESVSVIRPSPELQASLVIPPTMSAEPVLAPIAKKDVFSKIYVGSITVIGLYVFYRMLVKYR